MDEIETLRQERDEARERARAFELSGKDTSLVIDIAKDCHEKVEQIRQEAVRAEPSELRKRVLAIIRREPA